MLARTESLSKQPLPGPVVKLDPYKPANQQVYGLVRQAIIGCSLLPGAQLSEKEMALQFGVSRQPVREALIKLSQDGLIQVLPQRGTFVRRISAKRVADGRFIREALEVAIVERAAHGIGTEQLARLECNLQEQEQEARSENREKFLELDDAFHRDLAQSIDCIAAWQSLEDIKANMDRVRYLSLFKESPLLALTMQHRAIFDAIKAHDPAAASAAVRKHLDELNFSFASISTRNSEWFEN
ncbi:MAG: GntR family transcriptional regulator [Proteobacteria bacterium]|nr:GntR family transcriptional regulator [Pseudomonadota bacterium]